ncbi:hypothetical protein D3C87_1555280 [compost metagenome]
MRVTKADPVVRGHQKAQADVVAKLEGSADVLVGKARAGEQGGADTGFKVETLARPPTEHGDRVQLPDVARRTRAIRLPVRRADLGREIQAPPIAAKMVRPDRRGLVVQRQALVMVTDAVMQAHATLGTFRGLGAGHRGRASQCQTDKACEQFLFGRQHEANSVYIWD